MNHRLAVRLVLLVMLLAAALPVQSSTSAQFFPDPIILQIDGDFWSWQSPDQPPVQLTDWGLNQQPILSPDGTRVAYLSWAQLYVDWASTQTGGGGGYIPPENIWLLDIPSGHTYRIADQSPDAVYNGPSQPGRYAVRTDPAWSPDGLQLAWLEILIDQLSSTDPQNTGTAQLMVYDLNSKSTRILEAFSVSEDDDYIGIYDVKWGHAGIAFSRRVMAVEDGKELHLYDSSGTLLSQVAYTFDDNSNWLMTDWISDQDQEYLVYHPSWADTCFNWQTQQLESLSGVAELYSLSAPDAARLFRTGNDWFLEFPGQDLINFGYTNTPDAISRDGQRVASVDDGVLYIQSKDETLTIPLPGQRVQHVIWGPVGWRIRH